MSSLCGDFEEVALQTLSLVFEREVDTRYKRALGGGIDLSDLSQKTGEGIKEAIEKNSAKRAKPTDMIQVINDPQNPSNNLWIRR